MESEVLLGMAGTIERHRPIIYAESNSVDSGVGILSALNRTDYVVYVVRTAVYNPANLRGNPHNFFGVARECGLLCVPDEDRHLVPASTALVDVAPGGSLEAIVMAILVTPRYGDATCYDRDPARLRDELRALKEASARSAGREQELITRSESLEARLSEAEERRRRSRRTPSVSVSGQLAWPTSLTKLLVPARRRLLRSRPCGMLCRRRLLRSRPRGMLCRRRLLRSRPCGVLSLRTSKNWRRCILRRHGE
jgi:hypothetical protein